MGRDEAVAERLDEHKLHILGQWENPGLVQKAEAGGGQFHTVEDIKDAEAIADMVQVIKPDMFLTNFDDSLAAGVVDALKRRVDEKRMPDLFIPCPDQASARIEWDKFYLRKLIEEINPDYNPLNFMAETPEEVAQAIDHFENQEKELVLKPRNLASGKGVRVQGKHFDTYEEARQYGLQVLESNDQTGIEIQEKLPGHEFTFQFLTDGRILIDPPVTYDYPDRQDGDTGPGTGGMGSFSMKDGLLPFVTEEDYGEVRILMQDLLSALQERGLNYKGVLYPTFFKTPEGLKIVEINARGGDPELINVVDLMEDDVNFGEVLEQIAQGELSEKSIRYKKAASAVIYLVAPNYGYRKGLPEKFILNPEGVYAHDVKLRFGATERGKGHHYMTVGSSRTVGLSALGETPWEAGDKIHQAIQAGFGYPLPLDYRNDIAGKKYIKNLS